jgi:hypothetical protein
LPWSGGDPVQVMLNETALSVAPVDGRLTISFPTGDGLAVFTPPQ